MRRFKSPGHAQHFLSAYGPSPNTSDRDATGSPPRRIATPWPNDSKSGTNSQGLPQHKGSIPMGVCSFVPDKRLNMQ
jgi:hypothetical protein